MESEWRSAIMKFLLVLSLALAAVQAVHAVHTPLIYTHHTGCQNAAGAAVPCALGGVSLLGVAPAPAKEEAAAVEAVDRKKREAEPEADADADPYLFYSTHGYWPVGYSHLAYSYAPYTY